MAAPSDAGFKQLFTFPELALELLRTCLSADWTHNARLNDLERIEASYIGPQSQQRHSDVVWRLHRPGRISIHIAIEFQSTLDKWIALRMRSYVSLLCENLLKQRRATHGHLPILLPIVLYSGAEPWNIPLSLSELCPQPPSGLELLQPEQKYILVDRSIEPGVIRYLIEFDKQLNPTSDPREMIAALDTWLERQNSASIPRFGTESCARSERSKHGNFKTLQ